MVDPEGTPIRPVRWQVTSRSWLQNSNWTHPLPPLFQLSVIAAACLIDTDWQAVNTIQVFLEKGGFIELSLVVSIYLQDGLGRGRH
jgi:hypothetical protein